MNNKEWSKATGIKLKNKRLELGYSQQYIANILGVSKQTISHWENGDRQIYATNLADYAHAMNITIDELLSNQKEDDAKRLYKAYRNASSETKQAIQLLLGITL